VAVAHVLIRARNAFVVVDVFRSFTWKFPVAVALVRALTRRALVDFDVFVWWTHDGAIRCVESAMLIIVAKPLSHIDGATLGVAALVHTWVFWARGWAIMTGRTGPASVVLGEVRGETRFRRYPGWTGRADVTRTTIQTPVGRCVGVCSSGTSHAPVIDDDAIGT